MEHVFVGGGSAGACFSQVYGAALVNPEYADFINVHPAFPRENIRGLILNEPSLSMRLFEENMNAMYGCWLGADMPSEKPEEVRRLDVPAWITEDYLPTMLIASNVEEVFHDSAKALSDKLESIGVFCDFFYRSREEAGDLPHGFIGNFRTNEASKECMGHLKRFIRRAIIGS